VFNRRDLPLDGSGLLDDVIVSQLAARRPAPITDSAVGLLAVLVAAIDSRPIPDSQGAYDCVLDLEAADPKPLPARRTSEPVRLAVAHSVRSTAQPAVPIVIHRTWDGPRHRRNRPGRRRVTSSIAALSVVATTVGVSGVAAAVGGDPLRPFHSVVTRVWHGVAGGSRGPDAGHGMQHGSHVGSTTRESTSHPQRPGGPVATHRHPVQTAGTHHSTAGVSGHGEAAIGSFTPGPHEAANPTLPNSPVQPSGVHVHSGPVMGSGGSNQPGYPSDPVWVHPDDQPPGGSTPGYPLPSLPAPTVQAPSP
jgi:hypothetical protein